MRTSSEVVDGEIDRRVGGVQPAEDFDVADEIGEQAAAIALNWIA